MADQVRNPFGVLDVPDPSGADVQAFAHGKAFTASPQDANAAAWAPRAPLEARSIEGDWFSRWNGGTLGLAWKHGTARVQKVGTRVYLLFHWDDEKQSGLIEAELESDSRLVGRYVNLGNTEIRREWVGLIVDTQRIDGYWPEGRLDFRR
jgi:hypothetical protein